MLIYTKNSIDFFFKIDKNYSTICLLKHSQQKTTAKLNLLWFIKQFFLFILEQFIDFYQGIGL
ncbi:hypothetical protein BC624_10460 [Flavobacterium granuli]|uniref:Uncharacterized protein n=1 Tax=Flavobacterium granuli TaxID=280093 RepID=A0A1M5LG33_9FLAO|nr:hypothetical protein BC624_10460 [Flavobacterium granuli]SHG63343.1 hypothetical protein SAMN05443373_10360 [Flavobacterium granuli]